MTLSTPYRIRTYTDGYPIWELTDEATDSRVLVCPERGGIVIGCRLHGEELLYLDRDTFLDPEANIRGGIPILFPISGQLKNGQYEWNGRTYAMRNHGVARTEAWQAAGSHTDGEAALTLELRSNERTLAAYPFAFTLSFTYALRDGRLTIRQTYRNESDEPMPIQAGFHPYFATAEKKLTCETDATSLLDYNDGLRKPFSGEVDLNGLVESVALLDPQQPRIAFPLGDRGQVVMAYSELFRRIVLWSVQGKPFVCVEPWMALNGALNSGEGLTLIAPGEVLEAELTLAFEPRR